MVNYIDVGGYRVPVYSQSAFGHWDKERYGTVDAGDGSNYGVVGTDPAWGLDPATARDMYGAGSRYGDWTQWSLMQPGDGPGNGGGYGFALDPSGFDGMLKVGDKEGARFRYTLKDGQYVPEYLGNQYWNSNNDNTGDFTALAMVLGGVAAGALGGAAGAGAGGAGATGGWTGLGLLDGAAAGIGSGAGGWVTSLGGAASAGLPIAGEFLGPATNTVANPYNPALGASGASGASGLSSLLSNPDALRVGSTLLGGLLGSSGSGGGGGGAPGGPTPATNVPVPQIYGGNTSGFNGGLFNMGPQGDTQTEAMMRSYLPSLFGGAGIARTDIPQQTAKASLQDAFWPRYWS